MHGGAACDDIRDGKRIRAFGFAVRHIRGASLVLVLI